MEIIKHGKVPEKKVPAYVGTCHNCKCQVKCILPDPAVLPYSRTDPVFQVKCPTEGCDALIDLEEYVTRVRRGYAS
jgi:hypothetical protein